MYYRTDYRYRGQVKRLGIEDKYIVQVYSTGIEYRYRVTGKEFRYRGQVQSTGI